MYQSLIVKTIEALQKNNQCIKSCTIGKFNRIAKLNGNNTTKIHFSIGNDCGFSVGCFVNFNIVQCKDTEIFYVHKVVHRVRLYKGVMVSDCTVTNNAVKFIGHTVESVTEHLYRQGFYNICGVTGEHFTSLDTFKQFKGRLRVIQYKNCMCVSTIEV